MAILVGNYGNITINASAICEITEWTINVEIDRPDVTEIDSLFRQYGRGLTKGSGSFVSLEYVPNMNYPLFRTATFRTSQNAVDSIDVTGNIVVTKTTPRVSVDGLITWTYEFLFTDAFTIA